MVIAIGFLLFAININGNAQNNLGKTDDIGRISLTPIVPDQIENVPKIATNLLTSKLRQIASKNGLGGGVDNPQFLITANINVISQDMTATAPPMIAMNLEFTFYIVDYTNKTIFSNTIIERKGVGKNYNKAYINAIKGIKSNSPDFKKFVETAKIRIIEYYNSNCDFIIKDAQTLAVTKEYEHALFKLMSVPKVCKECYWASMEIVPEIFKQYQDNTCQENMAKARSAWADFNTGKAIAAMTSILPDTKCYDEAQILLTEIKDHACAETLSKAQGAWASHNARLAGRYVGEVPADSKCYPEAQKLMKLIEAKLTADEQKEWDNMLTEQKREYDLKNKKINSKTYIEAKRIDAYKEVAKSYMQSDKQYGYYDLRFLYR